MRTLKVKIALKMQNIALKLMRRFAHPSNLISSLIPS